MESLRLLKNKAIGWLGPIVFWCLIAGPIFWLIYPSTPDPIAEKAAAEKRKADDWAQELQDEKEFYAEEDKAIQEGNYRPTLIKVANKDGSIVTVTGRWLFIPQCPKQFYCGQPDGRLTDENGNDRNAPPEIDSDSSDSQ